MGAPTALDRLRAAVRRRPLAVDVALALGLAAFVVQEILTSDVDGPLAALIPLALLASLPLTVRRRTALLTVALVSVGVVALGLVSHVQETQSTLLPYLLAVYSAGAYAAGRTALAGLVVALVAITVDEPGDVIVLGPLTVATWLVGRLVRDWRRQAGELAALAAQLERERADTARHAVTDERARIARELHDVVGHNLSLLVLQAGAERLAPGSDTIQRRTALESIERSGRATLAELRRLVGVLRRDDDAAELAPLPGLAALPALVDDLHRAGVPVELRVSGSPVPLPPGLDVSAYRIVQEAVTNAVRHAHGATRVVVCTGWSAHQLTLEVSDDGRLPGPVGPDGHGLIGMRERAALFGGRFTAGPQPGGGWTVRAEVPLEAGQP
jgi:signal transduction histidine kinase